MPDVGTLLVLALLGTWAGLDGTAVGQMLLSRPLISGPLAGWLVGAPGDGLILGALLEGYHLGELPIGGARLPEPGPAAVPAVVAAVMIGGAGGLAIGLAIGILAGLLGGLSVVGQRYLNGWITRPPREGWCAARHLSCRHWACIAADGLRSFLLTALGLTAAVAIPDTLGTLWPLSQSATLALLIMPATLAAGVVLRSWSSAAASGGALFVGGCLVGAVLALAA